MSTGRRKAKRKGDPVKTREKPGGMRAATQFPSQPFVCTAMCLDTIFFQEGFGRPPWGR